MEVSVSRRGGGVMIRLLDYTIPLSIDNALVDWGVS